jgi:hypothetical protein
MMGTMKTLNRFALIVRPGPPFIEWAAGAFGESTVEVEWELAAMESSIYLLPESNAADAEDPGVLRAHWRAIFKAELEGWCTDQDTWPKNLSEAMFRAWFHLELVTLIHDRGKEPLRVED